MVAIVFIEFESMRSKGIGYVCVYDVSIVGIDDEVSNLGIDDEKRMMD